MTLSKRLSRFGNSGLLSAGDAFRLSLSSPKTLIGQVHDKVLGNANLKFPRRIVLHLANRCDFACPMCSIGQARADRQRESKSDTPFEIIEKLVREAAPYRPYFELTGGEPMLYARLGDVIKLLSEHGMLSYIVTDGLKLKRRAAELVESGLKVLLISMDGWEEESQKQRGLVPGSFQAIVDGIQEVMRARGKRKFPIIRINTVTTKVNYHSLDKIAQAVYEMGVRRWMLSPYYFMTDAAMAAHRHFKLTTGIGDQVMQHHVPGTESFFTPDELADMKRSLERLRVLLDGPLHDLRADVSWDMDLDSYYSPKPPSPRSVCNLPFDRVDIHTDGRIAVCGDGHTIGNMNSDSLAAAWQGEQYRRFRKVLDKHKVMPMCFRCCGIANTVEFDQTAPEWPKSDLVSITT